MTNPSPFQFVHSRPGISWVILVAATALSFAVGVEHGTGSLAAVAVLGLAAVKIRLVGLDFMELRRAPTALRIAFEVYCIGLWAVLSGIYVWL
jgi:heme/copper-type cytochrome/quinol oxidase subunit 4